MLGDSPSSVTLSLLPRVDVNPRASPRVCQHQSLVHIRSCIILLASFPVLHFSYCRLQFILLASFPVLHRIVAGSTNNASPHYSYCQLGLVLTADPREKPEGLITSTRGNRESVREALFAERRALFALQATIAAVENWERGYHSPPACVKINLQWRNPSGTSWSSPRSKALPEREYVSRGEPGIFLRKQDVIKIGLT